MNNEKLIPKLRFSGFTDEWNEVTLNDVATFSKGKGISKNDISDYGIECVRYGELYTKYNEMIYNVESKTNLDKNELKLSEKDDILIPCSGETAIDLATASCIQKDQVAIGGDITVIKTNQYAPFITYYLNQKKTEIAKYAQGVSIVHLYPKDFKVMNIRIPSFNEQKKIIALLEEITKKEQLLKSKYQEYQDFKKYLMQEIFAQKLRFNFTDEWNYINFSEIFKSVSTKKYQIKSAEVRDKGDFEVIDQGQDEIAGYFNDETKLCQELPIIIYGDHTTFVKFRDKPFIVGADGVKLLIPKFNANLKYLFYALEHFNIKPEGYKRHFSIIKKIKLPIPTLEEQNEISEIFTSIDLKLKYTQIQLQETKEFKKGLLQQMFNNMLLFLINIMYLEYFGLLSNDYIINTILFQLLISFFTFI